MGGGEQVLFWILGPMAVLASLGLLFAKKAVHAALSMALIMVIFGVFYMAEQAPFLGVIQVFVYTGAVMMLFLFVLMLVGVDASDSLVETLRGQRPVAILLGAGLIALLSAMVGRVAFPNRGSELEDLNATTGNVNGLANLIFGRYVWVFEITSALLITAAVAAMVLAHRERFFAKASQRTMSERRFREGNYLSGLPAPGVYARHNAVDTPALLPDGTPAAASVSRVLQARDQVTTPHRFVAATETVEEQIDEGGQE